jgi:hypothetical protein
MFGPMFASDIRVVQSDGRLFTNGLRGLAAMIRPEAWAKD